MRSQLAGNLQADFNVTNIASLHFRDAARQLFFERDFSKGFESDAIGCR
jgi:hypothetical protein